MAASAEDALSVRLRHRFPGGPALDVAFEAPMPGVVGLWGASGAGKSTVMAALCGMVRPVECRIALGSDVLADQTRWVRPEQRRVGAVFQDGRLFPHLSVAGNLRYGERRAGRNRPGPGFDEVVALLGLDGLLFRRPRTLSGGEAQRVAIGRALLSRPRLLALDEPLAALDAARRREILPFLRQLRERGLPMLYVTHSRAEAAALCDWIVVLEGGRVAASGPAAAVLSGPLLGGRADASALLEGPVRAVRDGIATVSAGGWEMAVPVVSPDGIGNADRAVRITVPARSVVLLDAGTGGLVSSARNLLPSRVLEVRTHPDGAATVRLGPDGPGEGVLLSRVTGESVRRMNIVPGRRLLAMVKAEAVAMAGEEDADG